MPRTRSAYDRRRLLGALLTTAAAGAAGGLLRNALAMGQRQVVPGVRRLRGEVRINGAEARAGALVAPGDVVSTGGEAQALVVIDRDAFLIRADSRVEFGGEDPLLVRSLRLITGKLLSVFAPRTGERRLQTGAATIGIRGTGIYLEAEAERTYACTCYGTADLIPVAYPEQRQTVVTTHHEAPRYIYAAAAGPAIVPAPVINHTDAELFTLEGLVDREPPFDESAY